MVVNNITDAYQTVQIVRGGEDGSKVVGCRKKMVQRDGEGDQRELSQL